MRFDDRLETTLRQADDGGIGLYAKWQQLVDMLAQNSSDFDPVTVESGLQKVRQLMDIIPATLREQCVRGLSGRLRSAPLLLLLSGDVPAVAAAAAASELACATRWWVVLRAFGTPLKWREAVAFSAIGLFYSLGLPGSAGGDAMRTLYVIERFPEKNSRLRYRCLQTVCVGWRL